VSAIRGIGDGYAIQRLLWLLVGTVIVPTILLALYGVTGVRAQQTVLLEQLRHQQQESLRAAARLLFDEVARLDSDVHRRGAACPAEGECPLEAPGVSQVWTWTSAPPRELEGIVPVRGASADTVWYGPPDGSPPIGVFAVGGRSIAFRLDPDHLADRLDDAWKVGAGTSFHLEGPGPGPAASYDEMLARWQGPTPELVLDRPLAQWRLQLSGVDPAGLGWSGWFYAGGLVILVGVVLVGALVTLGSASREIRLSRLQTDFVSSVSHELRTPLTSIKMFVETLQSGRLHDQARVEECLDLLAQETDRLSRRIERVLGWARMEAGRRIYDFEAVEARDAIDHAIRAVSSQALLDDLEIAVHLPDGLPPIRGDRDALVEALVNLLQNAVRYAPPPREIAVAAEARGAWVGLSVQDNGPGIAPRHRKRIFEKFYQADNLLASPLTGRGTGLGLAIVRAVVRAHGGRIALDTEVGKGSRFTLWLPAGPRPVNLAPVHGKPFVEDA
jgi:signal transduction histidine kinase